MISVQVRNLGPVANGSIEVHPLTVLVGANNAGKSVLATALYAALNVGAGGEAPLTFSSGRRVRYTSRYRARRYRYDEESDLSEEAAASVVSALDSDKRLTALSVKAEVRERISAQLGEAIEDYARGLATELERCFGAKLKDLVRRQPTKSPMRIRISVDDPEWEVELVALESQVEYREIKRPSIGSLLTATRRRLNEESRGTRELRSFMSDPLFIPSLYRVIDLVVDELFSSFPSGSWYLPAARSGILQSHKALASVVIRQSSLAGLEEMRIPKLSGVVTDFISDLIAIEPRRRVGAFQTVTQFLESGLLEGDVRIERQDEPYPEISYSAGAANYPLHRTSSMVSELAPVVLYLRYLVQPGDVLLLEEPESHLHPASQLAMAQAIAMLVESGLTVLLTTHSDYFLARLSNLLRLGVIKESQETFWEDLRASLDPEGVAAYLFHPESRPGTEISRLAITPNRGIPDDEFARVAEDLYAETAQIVQRTIDS